MEPFANERIKNIINKLPANDEFEKASIKIEKSIIMINSKSLVLSGGIIFLSITALIFYLFF